MADTVLTFLDSYCERAGEAGAWGEPLNLITNLYFIIGGVALARLLLRERGQGRRIDLWLLSALMVTIGLGSGAWHLMPTGKTLLMDVIPIGLFIHVYLISSLRRLFALPWWKVIAYWLSYAAASVLAQNMLSPDLLNGTIMYVPTYVALIVMTLGLLKRDRAAGRIMAGVLMVWTVSLVFRTVDRDVCKELLIGTHFLWHALNAWVLWRLSAVLAVRSH